MTILPAKASVHHWLAVAISRGTATLQDASEERVNDPKISALRDRIIATTDETIASDEMKLTFIMKSGEQHAIHIEHHQAHARGAFHCLRKARVDVAVDAVGGTWGQGDHQRRGLVR